MRIILKSTGKASGTRRMILEDFADIFGWTGPFAFDAQGRQLAGFGTETAFEKKLVFPAVAEVMPLEQFLVNLLYLLR